MSTGNIGAQPAVEFSSSGPMLRRAEQLTKMPASLLKDAEKAARDLVALIAKTSSDEAGPMEQGPAANSLRPRLALPKQNAEPIAQSAQNAEVPVASRHHSLLLAELMTVLEQATLNKLATNAKLAAMKDAMRQAGNQRLADDYAAKVDSASAMLVDLTDISNSLQASKAAISVLESQLAVAEARLSAAAEGTQEHADALSNRDALQRELTRAAEQQSGLHSQAKQLQSELDTLQSDANELLRQAEQLDVGLSSSSVAQDQSNIARMLALMTVLGEMMLKTGEIKGETQRSILKLQEDMRLKKMIKDAEKADKELQKAEAITKTMGCVGKILGAIVTVVSIAGAVFTGGASLALAGVGLALMLADQVYGAVTGGKSFIQDAMRPIMKLLQPILQFVMEKVAAVLQGFGVDDKTAKMAAMIAVSVAIAAAIVVVSITGVGGALTSMVSKVLSKMSSILTKIVENTIGKLAPALLSAVRTGARNSSAWISKRIDAALPTDAFKSQIWGQNLGRVAAGTNLARTAVTGGMEVGVSVAHREAAKAIAGMRFTMAELDLLNDMFSSLLEQFKNAFSSSQGFFSQASEAINQHASAGKAVSQAIRSSRPA